MLDHAVAALGAFVRPHEEWRVTLFRAQLVAGLLVGGGLLWRGAGAHRWRLEVGALLVLPVLAAMFAVGDIESGGEYRILAPHVLAALLIVARAGRRWTLIPAALNLILLPTLLPGYYQERDGRFAGSAEIRQFGDAVRDVLVFDEHATSGWTNTVLLHADLALMRHFCRDEMTLCH